MYGYVIVASWLVLIAVWVVGAFTAKPDIAKRAHASFVGSGRSPYWLLLIFALLQNPHDDALFLERRCFSLGLMVSWVGALLTIIGVAFAIWARYKLGRNWGSNTKKNPVLVTDGPYAYARHPIYAGAMLGLLGSALTGSIVAVVMFIGSIAFSLLRIHKEERVMLNLFLEQYPKYQVRTKRIIPFIW